MVSSVLTARKGYNWLGEPSPGAINIQLEITPAGFYRGFAVLETEEGPVYASEFAATETLALDELRSRLVELGAAAWRVDAATEEILAQLRELREAEPWMWGPPAG